MTPLFLRLRLCRARLNLWYWLACRLPRELVYWAAIRLFSHATTGKWSDQVVPDLTVVDALERWEDA